MPVGPNTVPEYIRPENASVFDTPMHRAIRWLAHWMGADDPTTQVFGLASPMMAVDTPVSKAVKAFHGSPRVLPELQPGSMMTTDPAWAAGYTTGQRGGIGPETWMGRVHAVDYSIPERSLTAKSLHDAETRLLDLAKQVLGRPAQTLREAADIVRTRFGYDAIVAKDAKGSITGVIPLTSTPVQQTLDPRAVVEDALTQGHPVASNLLEILRR